MAVDAHTLLLFYVLLNSFMIMVKAFDFLSKNKDVAFATVEQDKPKIRVFQIMKQKGHILVC